MLTIKKYTDKNTHWSSILSQALLIWKRLFIDNLTSSLVESVSWVHSVKILLHNEPAKAMPGCCLSGPEHAFDLNAFKISINLRISYLLAQEEVHQIRWVHLRFQKMPGCLVVFSRIFQNLNKIKVKSYLLESRLSSILKSQRSIQPCSRLICVHLVLIHGDQGHRLHSSTSRSCCRIHRRLLNSSPPNGF